MIVVCVCVLCQVDEARKFLKRPSVEDGELEPGSEFWCHFCHENANKHVTDRDVTIKFGGVFEHFARYRILFPGIFQIYDNGLLNECPKLEYRVVTIRESSHF